MNLPEYMSSVPNSPNIFEYGLRLTTTCIAAIENEEHRFEITFEDLEKISWAFSALLQLYEQYIGPTYTSIETGPVSAYTYMRVHRSIHTIVQWINRIEFSGRLSEDNIQELRTLLYEFQIQSSGLCNITLRRN